MSRTPIEKMIDDACGITPQEIPAQIKLYCPKCERTGSATLEKSDPEGAVLAHIQCPECVQGDFDSPRFFDSNDEELDPYPYE